MPPKADLGQLEGLSAVAQGATDVPMINGGKFDGAKAYKDSKVRQAPPKLHPLHHLYTADRSWTSSHGVKCQSLCRA